MQLKILIAATVAALLVLLSVAGCTTSPGQGTASGSAGAVSTPASAAAGSGNIDTMIVVHLDDFACLDVQQATGKEYLYPGEQYTLAARPPQGGGLNANVLLVDFNDNLKLRQTKPVWNTIQKVWVYEDLNPLVQFNDLMSAQQKSVTIKKQGKYYICIDDRKEMGVGDTTYSVPVQFTRTA